MMDMLQYDWTRYWVSYGGAVTTDEGFLVAPRNGLLPINTDLVPTDALPESPFLILLGEAGIGKSTEVTRLAAANRASTLSLGEFGDGIRLESSLARLFKECGDRPCVLDALDEAILSVRKAVHVVRSTLQNATKTPRIILTCRTGAWTQTFQHGLASVLGDPKVFELCSLRACDVEMAARARSIDADAFMRAIRDRRVESLASNPVTLGLLMGLHGLGNLPTSRVELYRKGLMRLCTQSQQRQDEGSVPMSAGTPLTAVELYETARFLAAAITLGGRAGIYTSSLSESQADYGLKDALLLEELQDQESAENSLPCLAEDRIRAAIGYTGLFSARSMHHYGLVHKSYAEFLTADELARSGVPPAQRRVLLGTPDDPSSIVPQLREVAAWLADMDTDFGRHLISQQPEILLRSDLGQRSPDDRREIVERMLRRINADLLWSLDDLVNPERTFIPYVSPMRLVRPLAHDELADQLRPWITDGSRNNRARAAAIELAAQCGVESLADDCVSVALDASAPLDLRADATRAAKALDRAAALQRLRVLVTDQIAETPPALLRVVVEVLWPNDLSPGELLAALDTGAWSDPVGHGSRWMCVQLAECVPPGALSEILTWGLAHKDSHENGDEPGEFISRVAYRAWLHLEESRVLSALAMLVVHRLCRHDWIIIAPPHSDLISGKNTGQHRHQYMIDNPAKRRRLLEACLPLVAKHGGQYFWLYRRLPLASQEDYEWALERACTLAGEEATRYAGLASWLGNFFSSDQAKAAERLEMWLLAMRRSDAVRAATKWPTVVLFGSDEERTQREEWNQELESKREAEADDAARQREKPSMPRAQHVEELLKRCESDCLWFPRMAYTLLFDDDWEWAGSSLNPCLHPGWKLADDQTRSAIAEAALTFLRDCPLPSAGSSANDVVLTADDARSALQIVAQHAPNRLNTIPTERMRSAMPLLLAATLQWNSEGHEGQDQAIRWLYSGAPVAFNEALSEWVFTNRSSIYIEGIDRVTDLVDTSPGRSSLLQRMIGLPHDDTSAFRLIPWLVKRGTEGAREHAMAVMTAAHADTSTARERACAIALLASDANAGWLPVQDAALANTVWGKDLIDAVAPKWSDSLLSSVIDAMNIKTLLSMVRTLVQLFPFEQQARSVSADALLESKADRWRDSALVRLAGTGSHSAVDHFDQLIARFPAADGLKRWRIEAERARQRAAWSPVSPSDLIKLRHHPSKCLVRGSGDLLDLLYEQLISWHRHIKSSATETSLWDRQHDQPNGDKLVWYPKDEESLRDRIELDLNRVLRDVVLGREVQLRRRQSSEGARGSRVDLLAHAAAGHANEDQPIPCVVIEVKGSWNTEADSGIEEQLADRYLSEYRTMHGLYLILWFGENGWDKRDSRLSRGPWRTADDARRDLNARAERLMKSRPGMHLKALVLDLSIP